jgi:hypothetical protein
LKLSEGGKVQRILPQVAAPYKAIYERAKFNTNAAKPSTRRMKESGNLT